MGMGGSDVKDQKQVPISGVVGRSGDLLFGRAMARADSPNLTELLARERARLNILESLQKRARAASLFQLPALQDMAGDMSLAMHGMKGKPHSYSHELGRSGR